jgi:hypothetical protein
VTVPARRLLLSLVLLVAAGAALLAWLRAEPTAFRAPGPADPPPVASAPALSLLVVGDTGEEPRLRPLGRGQRSVARGMAELHQRDPVDGLLLLGDNFYPEGLRHEALVERVARNLVGPFCRFADLTGPRSPEVASACALPSEQRTPVPIYAVLGNHDHKSPESPALQRGEIPRFLPNWRLPDTDAEVVELPGGVSLVLVDSTRIENPGSAAAVRDALRRARGPWRILAMHHPIALREGEPAAAASRRGLLRQAVAEAAVPVQLVLSGHRHNLQVLGLELAGPALHVISGAGAKPRPLRQPPFADRRFAVAASGFVRLDLLVDGEAQALLVSLYTVPRYPVLGWSPPKLVSRWWIEPTGAAHRAPIPAP